MNEPFASIRLPPLAAPVDELWHVLLDLAGSLTVDWTLVGVVMFAEDCPDDFCDRIRPALRAATEELSKIGAGGRFVVVPDSGHDIFLSSHGADIAKEIRTLLAR